MFLHPLILLPLAPACDSSCIGIAVGIAIGVGLQKPNPLPIPTADPWLLVLGYSI